MPAPLVVAIPTRDRHPVIADWYPATHPDGSPGRHLVVLCHGFKGHRRWGFIPTVATRLQTEGFSALALDFSHNGRVPEDGSVRPSQDDAFVSPELFRSNTIARELDDVRHSLAWLRGEGARVLGAPSDARVALWGHSRGGLVAVLAALENPSIAALVTWSALAQPQRYSERQRTLWREKGELTFTDYASGTALSLGVQWLDDVESNETRYNVGERAPELAVPHLIVHGEHDPAVPVTQAYRFYDMPSIKADKTLLRLLTGHTYGLSVSDGTSEALENATRATVAWFDTYLRGNVPSERA